MKLDEQIIPYLNENATAALNISDFSSATVRKLAGGDYNFNYHVALPGHDLMVRLNIEPQSGLDTQIEYEYDTLKFLAPQGVTPTPLFLDNSRKRLPYGLLVEEFIDGKHLEFSVAAMQRAATAMATLHTAPTEGAPLRIRQNPLREQVDAVAAFLDEYKQRQKPRQDILSLGSEVLRQLRMELPAYEHIYKPISIVHTDPNPANIIDTGTRAYFVDWEQGRIDDPSYDVAAFFSDVLNLWASPRILSTEEKQEFLKTYIAHTGFADIEEKIKPRMAAYTLTAVIWAAGRIADVDEGKIDPNLGAQNYSRYQAMSHIKELEKVLSA